MTAIEFAKSQGYRTARPIPPWHGYDCYEAIYGGEGLDDTPNIGLPQIILQKGGTFRMATEDETWSYMDEIEVSDGE